MSSNRSIFPKTVEEMLGLLKVCISERATLVTDLGEHLPAVKARAAQLRQIVMNLVVNASDAIQDRDGVIRVTTRRVTLARETACTNDGGFSRGRLCATGSLRHGQRHVA